MEIRIYGDLRETCEDVNIEVANIQQALAGLKQVHGQKVTDHILSNKFYYFLAREDKPNEMVPLCEGLLTMSFNDFDLLLIVPDIGGDVLYVVAILGVALFTTTSLTIAVITAVIINVAIALALGFLMQMLSPTPEFDSDPSEAQRKESSLFNGAPNIREQGGSVPWGMGESYAGGVLISAGLYNEDA